MKNRRRTEQGTPAGKRTTAQPTDSVSHKHRYLWLILALCLAGSAVASFLVFRPSTATNIPPQLFGTWKVVTEGNLRDATLQFSRHGTAIAIDPQGNKDSYSSVEVKDDLIILTTRDAQSGQEVQLKQAILRLTDTELGLRDEDGHVYQLRKMSE